jgi:pyruvate dehydrogenase E2 component (dihydrolipoamide acetyltransferase)
MADVVPVGTTIAWIVGVGEAPPAAGVAAAAPRISPKARRLAQEHHIDLGRVVGSGPGGELLASDVLALVDGAAERGRVEPVGTVWRLMAERTVQSWVTVPHFFVTRHVDASGLVEARRRVAGAGVTYTDVLVALVARVLGRHRRVNGSWSPDGIRLNDQVNIGIATAVDEGVVVTVVPNAATSTVEAIAAVRRDLTERVKAGRTRPADLAGATFTISNLGTHHVDAFSAIVNPPQAAILAVGTIADRVVAIAGEPVVRPTVTLTLSCDHRVVDGARAALFLHDVSEAIGDPERWL